jgi:hypothetical protein
MICPPALRWLTMSESADPSKLRLAKEQPGAGGQVPETFTLATTLPDHHRVTAVLS